MKVTRGSMVGWGMAVWGAGDAVRGWAMAMKFRRCHEHASYTGQAGLDEQFGKDLSGLYTRGGTKLV